MRMPGFHPGESESLGWGLALCMLNVVPWVVLMHFGALGPAVRFNWAPGQVSLLGLWPP